MESHALTFLALAQTHTEIAEMIHLVVTHPHAYTIQDYLNSWGLPLKSRLKVLPYEDLFCRSTLPRGAYIFTDLERLSPLQRQQADAVAGYLVEQGLCVLNRPKAVLLRYELLQTLYRQGVNSFRAVRLAEVDSSLRYPVFLRCENDHKGSMSGLIQNASELHAAILEAVYSGTPPNTLLVVEFCETADSSQMYRKYSAFLIGDRYVARHLLFSHQWMTKYPDLGDEAMAREEREYLAADSHPHETHVRAVFRCASIEYGRIDYGVLDGRVVVWEINTNPTIATLLHRTAPIRIPALKEVAARLRAAFEEIADSPPAASGAPLVVNPALRAAWGISERDRRKQVMRQRSRPLRHWLLKTHSKLHQALHAD